MILHSFVLLFWIPGWRVLCLEVDDGSNEVIDTDLTINQRKAEGVVEGIAEFVRNQPKSEKVNFIEMILRPELETKERIIETLVQESGNQFLMKNIRCLKRLYKYGTNQLLRLGVSVIFSDLTRDVENLNKMTKLIEKMVNVTEKEERDNVHRELRTSPHDEQRENIGAEIKMMENLASLQRSRLTSTNFMSYLAGTGKVAHFPDLSHHYNYNRPHHLGSRQLPLRQYYRYPHTL